jgi:TrmH family RNA methyltransferase
VPEYNRVTSVKSDRVTAVRGLQTRQGRRKAGLFLVEGPQAISSAVAAGIPIHDLFVDGDAGGSFSALMVGAQAAGARITLVTPAVMAAMAQTESPQGLLATCPVLPEGDLDAAMAVPGPIVVLESISDPGNVGTIIRTADAVGAAAVVLTPDSADVHNGKVVRSTAGSLFHLPVLSGRSVAQIAQAAHAHDRLVVVLTGDGGTDLFSAARSGSVGDRTVWVVGSEAHGVSPEARESADLTVRIPMSGRAESLNAAVAVVAALYVVGFASAGDLQETSGDSAGWPAE